VAASELPYLEQYFGAWAVKPDVFTAAYERVLATNWTAHLAGPTAAAAAARGPRYDYHVFENGLAVLDVRGVLMKQQTSMSASTSLVAMRRTIRHARTNPDVRGVMLRIDSPGGTVAGTQDLADEIAALRAAKPVAAYVEDLCASAAYWLASQAETVSANRGLVGSIGTYAVVQDLSGMAAKEGIKVHVVRAGKFKGAGVAGTEVTSDQLAEHQRIVDALNADFLDAVAKGRGRSRAWVDELADGRVHPAATAQELGLIDHVESFESAMDRLEARITQQHKSTAGRSGGKTQPGPAAGNPQETTTMKVADNTATAAAPAQGQPAADAGQKDAGGKPAEQTTAAPAASAETKPAPATAAAAAPATTTAAATSIAPAVADQPSAAYLKAFGDVGARWFVEGKPFADCVAEHNAATSQQHAAALKAKDEEIARLKAENDELTKRLAVAPRGADPVSHAPTDTAAADPKQQQLESKIGPNLSTFAAGLKLPKGKPAKAGK
jgi:signal peptide peptidase SppA